ncbi:RDD family protein [Streptomyces albogriseolus]|uniref:RDD family protein n=1 Tax=Streptomyces albogriseolus TaxID=1887 RepID=UPI0037A11F00
MSAPTPAPGDDRPREGYYPDPSIPGYVRYWNGASWVPGTSRPAPADGEPLAPPPGAAPAAPSGAAPAVPSVEETGPHFFDEDPDETPAPAGGAPAAPSPADAQHGSRPEPASAWGADRSRQSGFGGDQDRKVSWGTAGTDPRVPHTPVAGQSGPAASAPAAAAPDAPRPDGTFVFRRPTAGSAQPQDPSGGAAASPDEGTMTFRAVPPRAGEKNTGSAAGGGRPGFTAGKAAAERAAASASAPVAPPSGPQQATAPGVPPQATGPASAAPAASVPAAPAPAASAPLTSGPGGGQPSWPQQVHRLAGAAPEQPVAPWKPPVDDVFQAAARRQAAARPATLGRRLAARLLDTVVLGAVTAAAAVPLGMQALDHIDGKIEAAKLSGRTVTVWLVDGTTAVHLGVVLAVLLLGGLLLEVLPTVKWGRTLGKRLLGIEVRDIEAHEAPGFGAALRRWLVYSVPGLLVVGVVGVLWCLFDKPWRQCWHDKAAHTFVAAA